MTARILCRALSVLLVLPLALAVHGAFGQGAEGAEAKEPKPPMKVTVGAFLNSVSRIDLAANTFKFDAYVWFRWDPAAWRSPGNGATAADDAHGPGGTFEIVAADGQIETKVLYSRPGYCCVHVRGERTCFWDVRDFPFDLQRVSLVIEDGSFDSRELEYVADAVGAGLSSSLTIAGFRVGQPELTVAPFTYETTFGDPAIPAGGSSPYSRFTFTLPVHRDSWGLFFKLFSAMFISTVIAMLALFICATQVDPRFGLCVGGLFGIVGSWYLVAATLPDLPELCFADKLHVMALLVVLAVIVESAFSLSLHLNKGDAGAAIAKKLDRATFAILATSLVGTTAYFIVHALAGGASAAP